MSTADTTPKPAAPAEPQDRPLAKRPLTPAAELRAIELAAVIKVQQQPSQEVGPVLRFETFSRLRTTAGPGTSN